jgi:hypothetical protein
MGGGRSSPERELADIPVCGTSPWWHGKQEKGADPYPGWHEMAEGLGRLGIDEGRRQRSELDERVLEVRR